MERRELIDDLVSDLAPVRRVPLPAQGSGLWLLGAWAIVTAMTLATGSMRPGVVGQLIASPHFLLESLLGLSVGAAASYGALRLATPGPEPTAARVGPGLVLAGLWFAVLAYGLVDPALEPSMVGKRPHCFVETFVYSIPPLALAFAMLRRRAALQTGWTGALAGLAAAAVPALMMEWACMYDPMHILTMHMSPVPVIAIIAAMLGMRLLPRI
jgi:hypothetical protein